LGFNRRLEELQRTIGDDVQLIDDAWVAHASAAGSTGVDAVAYNGSNLRRPSLALSAERMVF
jgi:hypothetical protein